MICLSNAARMLSLATANLKLSVASQASPNSQQYADCHLFLAEEEKQKQTQE